MIFIDNYDGLYERYLPDISAFYSKLNKSKCDLKDYRYAHSGVYKFECKRINDYCNIHLKSDVLLLSNNWEKFRKVCYDNLFLIQIIIYKIQNLTRLEFFERHIVNQKCVGSENEQN